LIALRCGQFLNLPRDSGNLRPSYPRGARQQAAFYEVSTFDLRFAYEEPTENWKYEVGSLRPRTNDATNRNIIGFIIAAQNYDAPCYLQLCFGPGIPMVYARNVPLQQDTFFLIPTRK
jgi:hypothetical protein